MKTNTPIIIPAYEPDQRFITLLKELKKEKIAPIILVNDGSNSSYDAIFKTAQKLSDVILTHPQNYGKGRALKTAFQYVQHHYPNCIGVVTADSDGQHSVSCIQKIIKQMNKTKNTLVLGVRNFNKKNVPWKSRFGNKLTRILLSYVTGLKVQDTQTGLRGIPYSFLQSCIDLSGERFELEMQMLLTASKQIPIIETPIKTIYDSKENHQTHFNPLKDSIKIYKLLCHQFFKYVFSAISSFGLDICLFWIFLSYLFNDFTSNDIIMSTVSARIISLAYNYTLNYAFVFKSTSCVFKSALQYVGLATLQMSFSALFVTLLHKALPNFSVVGVKIGVDTLLFLISYYIQRQFIFSSKKK